MFYIYTFQMKKNHEKECYLALVDNSIHRLL